VLKPSQEDWRIDGASRTCWTWTNGNNIETCFDHDGDFGRHRVFAFPPLVEAPAVPIADHRSRQESLQERLTQSYAT